MKTRVIAAFLISTMLLNITGCNVNININDTPQPEEKKLYDAPQRNENIMLAKDNTENKEVISTNNVENLQVVDSDSHEYAGASYKLENGYLAVIYDKDKLWKLEVYGYETDGGLPYERVELANLVENDNVVRFDLIATTNSDIKEYYTYKNDLTQTDKVLKQIDLADYDKTSVFDKIDELKYGLFVKG